MATILVSVEGRAVKRYSGKPRTIIVGKRRKNLVKLLAQMTVLVNQEGEEGRRAATNRYTPAKVLGTDNSEFHAAFQLLQRRFIDCLKLKA